MAPRLHVAAALAAEIELDLPAGAARHVQVLRLQPGSALTLFDGRGGEWPAVVLAMGRAEVRVRVEGFVDVDRELALHVTLALGMPTNDRMDTLVEKATELGVGAIQPLHCMRSVLRLAGERASRKVAHWQAVAQAACEQCGRTRLPMIGPVLALADWLATLPNPADETTLRLLLSPDGEALPIGLCCPPSSGRRRQLISLSGPEGGLTDDESRAAQRCSFRPVSLGPRILRADTAPLALLARVACRDEPAARQNQGTG